MLCLVKLWTWNVNLFRVYHLYVGVELTPLKLKRPFILSSEPINQMPMNTYVGINVIMICTCNFDNQQQQKRSMPMLIKWSSTYRRMASSVVMSGPKTQSGGMTWRPRPVEYLVATFSPALSLFPCCHCFFADPGLSCMAADCIPVPTGSLSGDSSLSSRNLVLDTGVL